MGKSRIMSALNFNIDDHLNPYIPSNPIRHLPQPLPWFLGYRSKPHVEPPAAFQWLLAFIATLAGLCLVSGVFHSAPGIAQLLPPPMIASFGATAVLDYAAVRSPLAQPRNALLGHTFAAIVGVGTSKVFQHAPEFFRDYPWVAGSVGCAFASLVMSMTNTVHPPGGATAVLASTQAAVVDMGWWFVPVVLLGTCLMTAVACLLNNCGRQYPVYWWTGAEVGSKLKSRRREEPASEEIKEKQDLDALERAQSEADSERTLQRDHGDSVHFIKDSSEINLAADKLQLPAELGLTPEELNLLQNLQMRLRALSETGKAL